MSKAKTTKTKAKTTTKQKKTTAKKTTKAVAKKTSKPKQKVKPKEITEKDLISIKEKFMNSLDDDILNLIATKMFETGLPVESLSDELFNVITSIASRVSVDVGIPLDQHLQLSEEYYLQARQQFSQEYPGHFEAQQLNKKIDPKDLN
jgi:hypothetical protein